VCREFGRSKTHARADHPVVPDDATATQQPEQVGARDGERGPPGFARDEQVGSQRRQAEQGSQRLVRKFVEEQIGEHDVHRGGGLIQPSEHIRGYTGHGPTERGKRVTRFGRKQFLAIQQRDLGGDAPGGPETGQR